jgi:cation diffusion facilitator CzcD-associated flavoprotein CzcO
MILGHRRNGEHGLAGDVIVVGAGPAGLAAAAALRRARIPAVVLEQADTVGASWRDRYDRLRLNSARWFSTLPSVPYPRGTGVFPSRDEVVRYLVDYAERQALDVRLGVRVEGIEREGERWRVRTSTGEMDADHVIVAGGYDHRPFIPAWPGLEDFEGALLHAADYRSAARFHDDDVLVVGPGCSGAEIAYDLAEGGARRVRLAVRTPPNIILRSPIGAPLASAMMRLPTRWADVVMRFVRRRTIGDLTEFGLPVPEEGVFSRLRRLHVTPTIVDAAVIEAIRKRRIEIVAAVAALDADGVQLADGTRIEPDAVVAATGYGTGLEPVVGHLGVLDERGVPRIVDGEAAPGLRFLGYIARPAPLGHFGEEAERAAKAIARRSHRPALRRSRATLVAVNS